MKQIKNTDLQYLEIKSNKDLEAAVNFLEKGFGWGSSKSILLMKNLPVINKNIDSLGIMLKSNGNIVGAMIFFHQGFVKIGNEKKSIINLSGWYMHEKFRGIPSMTFLRFLLKRYDKSILTNYSAKPLAEKIYLAIGFKKMKLKRAAILISECLLNFSNIKIKNINKDLIKIDEDFEVSLENGERVFFLETYIENKKIQLIIKKRILRRSLLGISFNWRTATIIWSNDENMISRNWKKISNKLLFHTKSMKLIYDFYSYFPKNSSEKETNYMLYSNNDNLNCVRPIQSEMLIFD